MPKPLRSLDFSLAALAGLERMILYIIPYADDKTKLALLDAQTMVRKMWGYPPPHHPILDLRDTWPEDDEAGDYLHQFLKRLDALENGD